QTWKVFTY
ncbi:copper-translocating P-type ATPase, partial [Vibrio harveyi]